MKGIASKLTYAEAVKRFSTIGDGEPTYLHDGKRMVEVVEFDTTRNGPIIRVQDVVRDRTLTILPHEIKLWEVVPRVA